MLVSAHDGGVDHHVLVIVITRQSLENTFKNATLGPSAEASTPGHTLKPTLAENRDRVALKVTMSSWSLPERRINDHWIDNPGVHQDGATYDGQPDEMAPVCGLLASNKPQGRVIDVFKAAPAQTEPLLHRTFKCRKSGRPDLRVKPGNDDRFQMIDSRYSTLRRKKASSS